MIKLFSAIVGFIVVIGAYYYYDNYIAPMSAFTKSKQMETSSPPPGMPALTLEAYAVNRNGQNLTKITKDDVLAMGNIKHLDLSNNQLTGALPAEIRHLSNL
jgi:hypothetical protein